MAHKKMLAIDLGASSGRGIIGKFDGEKITLEEIHRFSIFIFYNYIFYFCIF